MTTHATVILANVVVAFFLLVLNFTDKRSLPKWRWATGSVLALAILILVVAYFATVRK
jgi:hypothetical protein